MGGVVSENITLALAKSLDISVVEKLHETLGNISHTEDTLNIDASKVERLDTATSQLLYAYQQYMDKKHISVFFVSPSEKFMEIINLLGLQQLMHVKH